MKKPPRARLFSARKRATQGTQDALVHPDSCGTFFIALLACACVASVYLLPQILAWHAGIEQSYFLKIDEPTYAARVVRFLQGGWSIGNPWTFEHRADPSLLPALPEWILGTLAAFLCISVDTLSWLARGLFSALGTWVFWRMLKKLGMSPRLALLLSVWAFADPGVYNYKPLEPLWHGMDFHPFNRFSNPLVALPLFMGTLGLWARIFLFSKSPVLPRVSRTTLCFAGVSLGLLFYVSIYYWAHLVGTLVLGFLLVSSSRKKEQAKALLTAFGIAALVALPYWVGVVRLNQLTIFKEVVWRTGILVHDRGWYLLTHRALWLTLLAIIPLFLKETHAGKRLLGASILAGFLCFVSSPLTGVTLQNFHWHYTLAPLCLAGLGWSLSSFWLRKLNLSRFKSLRVFTAAFDTRAQWAGMVLLLAMPLASGWVAGVREFRETAKGKVIGMGSVDQKYAAAWRWLRKNAPPESVVLAERKVIGLVPVRTGLRVWQDSIVELVPSQEILERNQVQWYLEGLKGKALVDDLAPFTPGIPSPDQLPVAQWCGGLTSSLLAQMRDRGYPVVDETLSLELAQNLSKVQSKLSLKQIRRILERYRLDYWVLDRSQNQGAGERGRDVFSGQMDLQKVFESEEIQIFKLSPISDLVS